MSAELSLQFVDTNVLVYAYDSSAGAKHARAQTLLTELWQSGLGCLSTQTLQEFYVNITKKVSHTLPGATATEIIADLGQWTVHTPQVSDILAAIQLAQKYQPAFWDALIVQSAAQLGCAQLWSEDFQAGRAYEGVQVVNPFV